MKVKKVPFPRTTDEAVELLDDAREMAGLEREGLVYEDWEFFAWSIYDLKDAIEVELTSSGIEEDKAVVISNALTKQYRLTKTEKVFFSHVRQGNSSEAKMMLNKNGGLVRSLDEEGNSPLLIAAENNKTDIMELCLAHGANIDHQNYAERTALHLASNAGMQRATNVLIKAGADCKLLHSGGYTALGVALCDKEFGVFTQLLNSDTDHRLAIRNSGGGICLPDALVAQYQQAVDALVKYYESDPGLYL